MRINRAFCFCLLLFLFSCSNHIKLSKANTGLKPGKNINIIFNKNIELLGFMMQMDNAPDFLGNKDSVVIEGKKCTWKDWYLLACINYRRYQSFDSCAMMQLYRSCLKRNLWNDFLVNFLIKADEVPYAKLNAQMDDAVILPFSPTGNMEDAKNRATEFLNNMNIFYKNIHFDEYMQEYAVYYRLIEKEVKKNLPPAGFINTLEDFYNKTFANYSLVPCFNILTSSGYGTTNKKTNSIYNTFGPFSFQQLDTAHPVTGFDFPEKVINLSVHEFGHPFVNPAIDKLPASLKKSTERLYEPIRDVMSKKAYTDWNSCLYEHFVRAGEVLIARKMGRLKEAEKILSDNEASGFRYLPFIVKELEVYDRLPVSQKDYDAFVFTIMEHLSDAKQFK